MGCEVLDLRDLDRSRLALAGSKAAALGELARIEGIRVPAGFCVTTAAFRRTLSRAPVIERLLDRLSRLGPGDGEQLASVGAELRRAIAAVALPGELASAISRSLAGLGEEGAWAVRSSATAEDLPAASFAGQHDSYLNVGTGAVLEHVSRCWASLFTEQAISYRERNGLGQVHVQMAVVVQQMVPAQAAGVLFTADPVTSNRRIASIEAVFGLGEALVSGRVNPDVYEVRDGRILARSVGGGPAASERAQRPALTDAQIVHLAALGRRIEAHFGHPQDVEWCLAGDGFQVVQSRPITTLFPIPQADDRHNHVYVSVGHQQMMTDAIKPLGLSFWQLTAARPMLAAAGRLFVDVTRELGSPATRAAYLGLLGGSDPLLGDALQTIIERGDFIPALPDEDPGGTLGALMARGAPDTIEVDPALVAGLIERSQDSIARLKREIAARSGSQLLAFILEDIRELKRTLFNPQNLRVIMVATDASRWLAEKLEAWLGEKGAVDTLTQSVAGNVTSEMGLALLELADVIRPHPEAVAFLENVEEETFLKELSRVRGGREAEAAIRDFLERYGMRCAGEIDITRPRWSERPATLVPIVLGYVRNLAPGAAARRFERGRQQAMAKRDEVLTRLREQPDGDDRAHAVERMIDRLRALIGYREYPKYAIVSRYFVYKLALLGEAERLSRAGVLADREDIFFLSFEELREVVRTGRADGRLIRERRDEFRSHAALMPPRVLTSDGEAIGGRYRREDVPAGALAGLPVSAGTIEGRARVVLELEQADLAPGDILVTTYTDPSWTPLFLAIDGLVTEVGGMMTHGAVIAREYGLPAVVGVQDATRLIADGQRIRLHGTDGFVEILR